MNLNKDLVIFDSKHTKLKQSEIERNILEDYYQEIEALSSSDLNELVSQNIRNDDVNSLADDEELMENSGQKIEALSNLAPVK